MKSPESPRLSCANLKLALPLFTCLIIFVTGIAVNGQTKTARPVARMINTANTATPAIAVRARSVAARRVDSVSVDTVIPAEYAHAITPTSLERQAFELINDERAANGETLLAWDAELSRVARMHSAEMARHSHLSHVGADGRDVAERAHLFGITGWQALAENIAYNQGFDDPVGFAVERWLKSVKHRENMLRPGFTHTAIGVAESTGGRVYFTQVFITR